MSMRSGPGKLAVVLLAVVVALTGCKKKERAAPTPQAQAPTIAQPEPQKPQVPPETAPAKPEPAQPTASEPAVKETAPTPPPKPQPSAKKPKSAKKPQVAKKTEPAPAAPPPLVAKPARPAPEPAVAAPNGQLSAGMSHTESQHQRATTAQLLDSAEANLKSINRLLTADEQAMVQQIRNYMHQSRDATAQGDTERAYTLALKAHLLSDEIAKPK